MVDIAAAAHDELMPVVKREGEVTEIKRDKCIKVLEQYLDEQPDETW